MGSQGESSLFEFGEEADIESLSTSDSMANFPRFETLFKEWQDVDIEFSGMLIHQLPHRSDTTGRSLPSGALGGLISDLSSISNRMEQEDAPRGCVGIDLGTTRTAVGHVSGGKPQLVENAAGNGLTPSVVHLTDDETAIVGEQAKDRMILAPQRTVAEVKRQIGEDQNVRLGTQTYTPEEISAMILTRVVGDAADQLDRSIDSAVITVPAYFTGRQRTATRNAGEIAGIDVVQLLPEPSAAVLAYGHERQQLGETIEETIFVYDLGGGTFDATLVEAEYEHSYVETVLTDGESELGGADWTAAIEDWIITQIREETGVEIRSDEEYADQRNRIHAAAEEAKHTLSHDRETVVTVPFVVPDQSYSFEQRLSRETFEELTEPLLERTRRTVADVLAESGYERQEIDTVLLVGGASRMPQVEDLLELYFGQPPSKRVSADKAVALGAGIQASILSSDRTDETQLAPGDDGTESSPDGITESSVDGIVLIDVLPQTLGVELVGDRFSPIIENGTQLPTTVREETYTTVDPDQTAIKWQIRQGESERASDNDHLGTLWIRDIPPRDPDRESIAIEFTMTGDGTLAVEIEDMLTNKTVDGTIESVIHRSSDELDRMSARLPDVE